MRAVDTNVLVRLVTRDDPRQVAAAEAWIANGAWVSHVVLVEWSWVLATVYDVGAADLATAIDMILAHRQLSVQEPGVVTAAVRRFRANLSVGFSDCLILEIARKAGHVPLGTFDRGLGRLPGAERL